MARIEVSRGDDARVYQVSPGEKLQFPQADLVRFEVKNFLKNPSFAIASYYELKIAGLLFPERFIHVVGAHSKDASKRRIQKYSHRLLSKRAAVPKRHDIYAKHMTVDEQGEKASSCPCGDCSKHRRFHKWHRVRRRAEKTAKTLQKAGLLLPHNDLSDYCLSRKGVVFLEIEDFFPAAVQSYIDQQSKSQMTQRANDLLARYQALREK